VSGTSVSASRESRGGGWRTRRSAALLALGAVLLLGGALLPSVAAAAPVPNRTSAGTITGLTGGPSSVAVDQSDNVWVTDGGESGIKSPGIAGVYKYDPFPSQDQLAVPQTYGIWSPGEYLWLDAAVDDATGEIFVGQTNGREVDIFAPSGPGNECEANEPVCFTRKWTRINGALSCFTCTPTIKVAVDNSGTYSEGRVYLALTSPENDIEVVDAGQRPVDFPASASYIADNKLTGTPNGRFGSVGWITVDGEGNLYVVDWGKHEVDEFDSTGTFLRSFPAPRVEEGVVGTGGITVDPTNGNLLIDESVYNEENGEGGVREFDESGNFLGADFPVPLSGFQPGGAPVVNSNGYLYVPTGAQVDMFNPAPRVPTVAYKPVSGSTPTGGTLNATVDPNGGGNITQCHFEYGSSKAYGTTVPCAPDPNFAPPGSNFGTPTEVSATISGLTSESTYHYRVVARSASGVKYGEDELLSPHKVVGLSTEAATNITEGAGTLNASFVGNGESTHYHFEWGRIQSYGESTSSEVVSPSSGTPEAVSVRLEGLEPYSTYHFRVVATNGAGSSVGIDRMFTTTPGVPEPTSASVTLVHSDRAVFHAQVVPEGAPTTAFFEYVPDAEYQQSGYANAVRTAPRTEIGMSKHPRGTEAAVTGLEPGTEYHYRVVGENSAGEGSSVDRTFTTFAFQREVNDGCPNAHVRQQTGSSLLLDCRSYELVSAANAGGYDVESSLVPGQTPFGDYPEAADESGQPRVLYGIHDGGVPGVGNPTNRGVDPYVATRGSNGWSTSYAGLPAEGTTSVGPFSSTLAEATPSLDGFAFGGPEICSPCFEDGSRGMPIRLSNGGLIQGMRGSLSKPEAEPAGYIGRHYSAEGAHFVFGSTTALEPDAEEGKISIYDRNLAAGPTNVVSKLPGGGNIPCVMDCTTDGIGELAISKDGSRIVVGQLVSKEGAARYWHLYMDIGDSGKTIDLTPGTSSGALFDGMTADGSRVFYTTGDEIATAPGTAADEDNSSDIYEAEGDPQGGVAVHLVSSANPAGTAGEPGNTDACDPSANTVHEHWNTTTSEEDCGVVAVGGGGGVASDSGRIYFLSPEQLEGGNGTQNAPNLYVSSPGGPPKFVATLESSANAPLPPEQHSLTRTLGNFAGPTGVAIDRATGDIYVLDAGVSIGEGYIFKFTPNGKPILTFGTNGKLGVSGMLGFNKWPTQIAVDNDPTSPSYRDLYVPEIETEHNQYSIQKYGPSGEHLQKIESYLPTGVAVNPSNGNVNVTSFYGFILIYTAEGALSEFQFINEHSPEPEGIAVDGAGNSYVVNGGGPAHGQGATQMYDSSGHWVKQIDKHASYGVAIDQSDGHIYVDEGSQVSEFDSSGAPVGIPTGSGVLGASISLAADDGSLAVSNPESTNLATFGPMKLPFDPETDNPLVIDSVSNPGDRETGDFEITPSGNDAAFPSTMSLTGYDNGDIHREIFRDDASRGLECVSCNPTSEQASGEASLPGNGLGISVDGRVFFDSTEGLVDRDLNAKEDAYQWEPQGYEFGSGSSPCERSGGCVDLVSPGSSPFAANLLGISAGGTDAYFFTRDKLSEEDENGSTVKIYDARSLGGFPFVPPEPQCKASDECHGAGSVQPGPPQIRSIAKTPGGNIAPEKCKRGFVRKHGTCVRRHKHRHHRKGHRHG
jgi:hypothetical protein